MPLASEVTFATVGSICLSRVGSHSFRLLPARRRPLEICIRHLGTQMRRVRDNARADSSNCALLVSLVKADAQGPPLSVQQALKVLRLDIFRKILSGLQDVRHVHLLGFYSSSAKTADVESDMWVTLSSLGVVKPDYVCSGEQLQGVENRLAGATTVTVDLSAADDPGGCRTTVRDFLRSNSVQLLRLSALLESDTDVEQAAGAMQFYRVVLSAIDDYVTNRIALSNRASVSHECNAEILKVLSEQEAKYLRHLSDFETRLALDALWEAMLLLKSRLESDTDGSLCPLAVLAAKERLLSHLARLGVTLDAEAAQPAADGRVTAIVDAAAAFRRQVRSFALQDRQQRAELISACDSVRDSLLKAGVKLQDKKDQAPWLWALSKKT